jgi:hypothetical protein
MIWHNISAACEPMTRAALCLVPVHQVSIGRLGIITKLTFEVVPQRAVQRSLQQISFQQFVSEIQQTQAAYNEALDSGSIDALGAALAEIDETQVNFITNFSLQVIARHVHRHGQ